MDESRVDESRIFDHQFVEKSLIRMLSGLVNFGNEVRRRREKQASVPNRQKTVKVVVGLHSNYEDSFVKEHFWDNFIVKLSMWFSEVWTLQEQEENDNDQHGKHIQLTCHSASPRLQIDVLAKTDQYFFKCLARDSVRQQS